jgi:pimeloyl-ACP methyl ester carboxylesterase
MGYSDRGPHGSTTREGRARDLKTLLERAEIRPPYVLVGHSLGGLYVREFARRYPDNVAGLVFVDSSHEEMSARATPKQRKQAEDRIKLLRVARYLMPFAVGRLARQSVSNAADLPERDRAVAKAIGYRTSSYFAVYDEIAALLREDEQGTLKLGSTLDVPLVVITSERNLEGDNGPMWKELQAELVELSPSGKHVIAEGSGHFVHVDRPDLVVEAIKDVLEAK